MSGKLGISNHLYHYYLSYDKADAERVSQYIESLEKFNVPMFYNDDENAGGNWEEDVAGKIEKCESVILFVSKNTFEKNISYVRAEYEIAVKIFNKEAFVVLLDEILPETIPMENRGWWLAVYHSALFKAYHYSSPDECAKDIVLKSTKKKFKAFEEEENESLKPLKAYEGDGKYIFISYAHKDKTEVYPIMRNLQDEGYKIWYDDGIKPGNEWDDEIAEHILGASVLLAFISDNYIASDNCKDELKFARDENIERILIYIEDTKLPAGIKMRIGRQQAVPYYSYENKADFYEKLFSTDDFKDLKE